MQSNITNLAFVKQLTDVDGYYVWADGDTLLLQAATTVSNQLEPGVGQNADEFFAPSHHGGTGTERGGPGLGPGAKTEFFCDCPAVVGLDFRAFGERPDPTCNGFGRTVKLARCRCAGRQRARSAGLRTGYFEQPATDHDQWQRYICWPAGHAGGHHAGLQGVGRFSGTYTVQQATHTINAGGYQTSFEVRKQS